MWKKIWLFYYDGFKTMTVGKTLWWIIIIKIIILFLILRLFLFPRSEPKFMFNESGFYKQEQMINNNNCKEK